LGELLTKEQSKGIEAGIIQSIDTLIMKHFTLFLVLDHFKLNPESGFPDHPDRGQKTISYLFKGRVDHEDLTGLKCTLEPGDLQFMTAGRGIMNPEFPKIDQEKDGSITYVEGLQLWVDLPAKLKDSEPRYRDLRAKGIPIARPDEKITIKVISGQSYDIDSEGFCLYPHLNIGFCRLAGGKVKQNIPTGYNSFLYIVVSKAWILGKTYTKYTNILFRPKGTLWKSRFQKNKLKVVDLYWLLGRY